MQLTRYTTKIIKGVAILMMITLHCVTTGYEELKPDWPWLTAFGEAMKLCVAVFALMVGYGYAFQKQKTVRNGAIRAGKLLVQYWVLLFLVFIPGDAILSKGEYCTAYQIVTNSVGLESNLHWFNWFLYLYIWAVLLMPFVVKVDRRFGGLGLAVLAIGGWLMECAIHQLVPAYTESIWLQALFDCLLVSPSILLGYWLARSDFISRIPASWTSASLLTGLNVICVLARMWLPTHIYGFQLDGFYAAAIVACVADWANLTKSGSVGVKTLAALGEMSMLMWFIHAVFVMECWRTVTDSWTLWLPLWAWPVRMVLITAFSYAVARLFAPLASRLSSLIFDRQAFARA